VNDRKHVIVGLFVLVGLIFLGIMVVWFEGVGTLIRGGYHVHGHLLTSIGVRSGKRVHMDGIEIGSVTSVTSSQPKEPGVWVHMRIDPGVRIPLQAALVAQQSTMGDLFLDFQSTTTPTGYLPTDGTARIEGALRTPSLLPENVLTDVREGLSTLKKFEPLITNLTRLTEPRTLKDLEAGQPRNLSTAIEQFEVTVKSLQDQMNQPESGLNQTLGQARATLAETKKTMATINQVAKQFEEAGSKASTALDKTAVLADKLTQDAEKAEAVLDQVNALLADLREGKGTMGKMLTDDELHRALVNLVENLQGVTDNANRLLIMWRKEGVLAKEKK